MYIWGSVIKSLHGCLQFDWDGDFPPRIPQKDLVIYETHVRGFTKHSSSEVDYPGTYIGLVEKLSYLKVIVLLQEDFTLCIEQIKFVTSINCLHSLSFVIVMQM